MDSLRNIFAMLLVKDGNDKTVISFGTLALVGLGAGLVYYSIPERKRRNMFN